MGDTRRTLAVWCPDWPAMAAAADADISPERPVAVIAANRVLTCSATARASGVRRGMRKRESQARCPQLYVATADPGRDGRHFDPVVAAVAEVIPIVEVLRPGLMVLPAAGAARYFGGEEIAAEKLIDVVSACGVESFTGIADELFTAVTAARHGAIVPSGDDAEFLAPLPIAEIGAEPSLGADRADLVDLLWRLGVRTVGAFATLAAADVATRFGSDAVIAHRAARATPGRGPSAREQTPEIVIDHECDPPIERVDAAAFVGRRLADELHRALMAASAGCTRLTVEAITTGGQSSSRVWRCAQPLTPEATADRIRWQLDGWLTGRDSGNRPDSPIARLRLEPVELVGAGALQFGFRGAGVPGGDGEIAERARRALVRVQGLLGGEAVRVPTRSGGRGVAERITLIPLGDEMVPAADPDAPWPGRIPEPAPTVLLSATVSVCDGDDDPVRVTSRGMFSAEPVTVAWGSRRWSLQWWAGPWPADERWWAASEERVGAHARAQVLLDDSRALLLRYQHMRWTVEGVYE